MQNQDTVGFIGLGNMGSAMAVNLMQGIAPKPLHVWNRTKSKADDLVKQGAVWLDSIQEVGRKCNIIICVAFDDSALKDILNKVIEGGPQPGTIFASCSTVHPDTTKELVPLALKHGIHFMGTPVFGRPDAAAKKILIMVLAGHPESKKVISPYLMTMGRAILDSGDEAHLANVQKLVGNFFVSTIIELSAEAQTLAEKNGLDRQKVVEFVDLMFPIRTFQIYNRIIADEDFSQGFSVSGGLKDVGLIRDIAQKTGTTVPIADITYDHLSKVAPEDKDKDWAVLSNIVKKESNLPTKQGS
ncbi:hypothetical protein HDV06_004080 [Boothiomyces sp. JEL0866]|nr:hypothetical protein HDV06_004080 [Boothiomyces sp. JEL0866]